MKLVIVILFSSLFASIVISSLHDKSHAIHHLRRDLVTITLINQMKKIIVLTQTTYCTVSQKQTKTVSFSSDNSVTNFRHDDVVIATSIRHSTSKLTSVLSDAIIFDECTQFFSCSDDIINYDSFINIDACEDLMYQSTDSVIVISYNMMRTLSSSMKMNSICVHHVQIKNSVNERTTREIVVNKCKNCVSTSIFEYWVWLQIKSESWS